MEFPKHLVYRPAIGLFDDQPGLLAGEWRYLVLQAGQFLRDVIGEQIAPCREDLTKLDENRAQVLERLADTYHQNKVNVYEAQELPGPDHTLSFLSAASSR